VKGNTPFTQQKLEARTSSLSSKTLIGIIKDLSKFTLRPVESAKVKRMSFKLFSSLRSPLRKIKVSSAY
jgi:hypothetical protein